MAQKKGVGGEVEAVKVLRIALAGMAVAAVLVACGLLPSLPDQTALNPLQLDGLPIKIDLPPAGLATAVTGSGSVVPIPFVNREFFEETRSPRQLAIDGGFGAFAVVVDGAGTYPDILVLTGIGPTLRLWEGASSFDEATEETRLEVDFVTGTSLRLDKLDLTCTSAPCSYTFSLPILAESSLPLTLSDSELDTAMAILTGGSNANFVQAVVTLEATSTPELGPASALVVTVEAGEGMFEF